jgi:endonuclease YncB( thermonuclease family)
MRPRSWRGRDKRRGAGGTIAALALIAVLALIAYLVQPGGGVIEGRASASDGDSLRIDGERIRLTGFDAVELDQTCTRDNGEEWACGRDARAFLAGQVAGRRVACTSEGRDQYGRVLATCRAGDTDLGDAVVRAGWAVAELRYAGAALEARRERRGIWAGRFVDPAEWRRTGGEPGFDLWGWLLSLLGR